MIERPKTSSGEKLSKEKKSDDKSYYYALIDEYLNSGQTGRALIQAAKNIAYHEDDPVAYINRARVYEKLGALENAILDLKVALRLYKRLSAKVIPSFPSPSKPSVPFQA